MGVEAVIRKRGFSVKERHRRRCIVVIASVERWPNQTLRPCVCVRVTPSVCVPESPSPLPSSTLELAIKALASRMPGLAPLPLSTPFLSRTLPLPSPSPLPRSSPPPLPALAMASSSTNGVAQEPVPAPAQAPSPPKIQVAKRLEQFKTTIFTEISILALKHKAINLGQGFPNFDGPDFVKSAAIAAIQDGGKNQYARGFGVPQLNAAIAESFRKESGIAVNPDTEVTVTSGCTEAIAATVLGLVNPGDEVILFEPFYDSYQATVSMSGATIRTVTLRAPHFAVPEKELRAAFSANTRAILVNTPHNPTGKVFSRKELELIASLCKEHDALAFADEVYNKLVFKGEHVSLASLDGMYERTVTMNSLGKTFSLTGWKIGWAVAPPHLTWGLRLAHSYLTFATATPFQWAAAEALRAPDSFYAELIKDYSSKRDILVEGLKSVGFKVYEPEGTYFVMVDHTPFGFESDVAFCKYLIEEVGVAAIPPSVFYTNPEDGKNLVRFAFCKDEQTLRDAVEKLKAKLKKPAVTSSSSS